MPDDDMPGSPLFEQMKLQFLPLADTISVFSAARVAGVSCHTIRRWCDEGRISFAYKLVGRWRIDRAQFLDWIDRQRTNGLR